MSKLLANPWVRLAGRAAIAGVVAALTQLQGSDGTIAWKALAVAAALAFCEVFTPLNPLVGFFKGVLKPATPAAAPHA